MTPKNPDSFSKIDHRKISSFTAQEMLYDYVTDHLDPQRKKAVKESLAANPEVQSELKNLQNAVDYVRQLAETQVSQALSEKVKQPTNYLQVALQKVHFDNWPPMARMGLEACLVAVGIMAFAVLIPWNRLINTKWGSSQVILSEIDNQLVKKPISEAEMVVKEQPAFQDEGSGSEIIKPTTTTLKTVAVASLPDTPKPITPTKTAVLVPASTDAALEKEQKGNGFLYRGTIQMTNAKATSVKIVERISALGARKAGNVELGWSKGSGAYFHFTMPESKYEETLEIFKEYGQLKIQKEKHERLMPDGIIRLIIDAEEKR